MLSYRPLNEHAHRNNQLISAGTANSTYHSCLTCSRTPGFFTGGYGHFLYALVSTLALSLIGNLLPVPFLLLFYDSLAHLVSRINKGKRFMEWLHKRTRRQTVVIEKYKHVGLIIFVAIPLPGTGAWTASIAAHLLGMKFRHAFFDIALGVIVAGVIVTTLVLLGWIGAGIALAGLIVLATVSLRRREHPKT